MSDGTRGGQPNTRKPSDRRRRVQRERPPAALVADALLDAAPVGLAFLDDELRFTRLNRALAAVLEHTAADASGHRPSELGDDAGLAVEELALPVLVDAARRSGTVLVRHGDAGRRFWDLGAHPLQDGDALRGVVVLAEEVTERRRLGELVASDPLTGLANHGVFYDRLRSEVGRAERHGRALALALIDVDEFKAINDTFGHQAGDQVLVDVASRLAGTVLGTDLLARIGGDEFAIVMPETEAAAARVIADRAHARAGGVTVGDRHRVTVTIGVSGLADTASAESSSPRPTVRSTPRRRRGATGFVATRRTSTSSPWGATSGCHRDAGSRGGARAGARRRPQGRGHPRASRAGERVRGPPRRGPWVDPGAHRAAAGSGPRA